MKKTVLIHNGGFSSMFFNIIGPLVCLAALLRKKKEVEALRGGTLIHDKYLSKV